MEKFKCDLCDSEKFYEKNGFRICEECGLKYPIEEQLKNNSILVDTQHENSKPYNAEKEKLKKELLHIQSEINICEKQKDEIIKKNNIDKYWQQLENLKHKNLLTEERKICFIQQIKSIETQAKKVLELIDLKIKNLNQKVSQIKSKL